MSTYVISDDGNLQETSDNIAQALSDVAEDDSQLAKCTSDGRFVVVLDPGHGGKDSGATSSFNGKSYIEKNLNLKIAQYCKAELEAYSNVDVYMTRMMIHLWSLRTEYHLQSQRMQICLYRFIIIR